MAELTLQQADTLSPDTARNQIVESIAQLETRGPSIADVLPPIVLTDSAETYYRRNGHVLHQLKTDLHAESPVTDQEDLSTDEYNVDSYKSKISPEKGADFELNTQFDLLNAFDDAIEILRRQLMLTREQVGWQGLQGTEGLIGEDGDNQHSGLATEHVITGATAFSNHSSSTPQDQFQIATGEIDQDGTMLNEAPQVTGYVSPTVMEDLKRNDDIQSRFSGVEVQGLTQEQVASILPIDNLEVVYTKTVRTNDNYEPIDSSDNVVTDRDNAILDNVLEPYDYADTTTRRNIVIGTAGDEEVGGMPVLTDRLSNVVERSGQDPLGDFSVDESLGFVMQSWFDPDPSVTWFKIAQEVGVELVRPENWAIIQDI